MWIPIAGLAVLATAACFVHMHGVERRAARVKSLVGEIEGLKLRQGLLMDDLRKVAKSQVDAEFKLQRVDALLETMNSDIADAGLLRQPIDLQIYHLNQKQHELLVSDLERYRGQAGDIEKTSATIAEREQRIAREVQDVRGAWSFRAAFW